MVYENSAEFKSAQKADPSEDRLKALAERLIKKNKESKASSARMEKLTEDIENERKRRVEMTVAAMAKNAEMAEKNADERSAILEYSEEYKLRLMAQKDKEAAKMAKQLYGRERNRVSLAETFDSEIFREADSKDKNANEEIGTETKESETIDQNVHEDSVSEISILNHSEESLARNCEPDVTDDADTVIIDIHEARIFVPEMKESEEDDFRIKIGGAGKKTATVIKKTEPSDGEMLLNIGGAVLDVPMAESWTKPESSSVKKRKSDEMSYEREMHVAELKHRARVCAAIQAANGAAREEMRLLREEQERYEAEISGIKEMRLEYNYPDEAKDDITRIEIGIAEDYGIADELRIDVEEATYQEARAPKREELFALEINEKERAPLRRKEPDPSERAREIYDLDRYERHRMRAEPRRASVTQKDEQYVRADVDKAIDDEEIYIRESSYSESITDDIGSYSEIDRYDDIADGYEREQVYPDQLVIYKDKREDYQERIDADAELELLNARERAALIKKSGSRVTKIDDLDLEEAHKYHMREQEDIASYHERRLHLFAKAELASALSGYAKAERSAEKRILKINAKAKGATLEEATVIAVERIALQKELCEVAIDALSVCVSAEANGKITKYRRKLALRINEYNSACEEYETLTGRPLHRLDSEMINDVIEGRMCEPIPAVYYFSEDEDKRSIIAEQKSAAEYRHEEEERLISEEYQRYVDDPPRHEYSKEESKSRIKAESRRISAIKRAAERDMLLFTLRSEKRAESLIEERDLILNSFGQEKRKSVKRIRDIEQKIHKQKAEEKNAAAIERQDNTRYYLLAALDPEKEKIKPGARRERLDAMRSRLNILLSERESINERLIALYGGSDRKLVFSKISKKAVSVRRKAAKSAYKAQKHNAKKIELSEASDSAKEEAYGILNRIIAAKAKAAEYRYKLRKLRPAGKARRELVAELKRAEAEAKISEREVKYAIKRFKYDKMRKEANREWFKLLAIVAALTLLGIGVWYFLGDKIVEYFMDIKRKLGG